MSTSKNKLPTYDFFKRLNNPLHFEYSKLEQAYNSYDSSHAHRHDYFEVIIFDEDGGNHEIDFVTHPVNKNSVHFISPGQVHLLRREKHVTGHVLAFKEEVFVTSQVPGQDEFMMETPIASVTVMDKKSREKIDKALSNLVEEYSETHPYVLQSLSAYLLIFLIEVFKLYEQNPASKKLSGGNILYNKFRRLVDKNIFTMHTVSEYASLLSITPGHLNDTVKNESGKNASEVIHERLILEAKRLLYHSSKSIKEIAASLNYEDPSYFIRFFRTHAGVTPSEFRETIRAKYV